MTIDVATTESSVSGRARRGSPTLAAAVALCLTLVASGRAAVPRIDLIEPFGANQCLIHFYTDPFRQYVLQFSTNAHPVLVTNVTGTTTNVISTNRWFHLYTVPCSPANNHYVILTGQTNSQRFYRLRVTNCN